MRKELFSAFKLAIEKEQEANDFYTYLAGQTDDEELKRVLLKFAHQEAKHRDELMRLYERMKKEMEERSEETS